METIVDKSIKFASDTHATNTRPSRFWPSAAVLSFGGACLSFFTGIVISGLAELGIVPVSRATAYLTVATLLCSFGLAFLGAHCLDRDRAIRNEKSGLDKTSK